MSVHPERKELFEAARTNSRAIDQHLSECEDCSLIFAYFKGIPEGELAELPSAPAIWIERAAAVITSSSVGARLKRLTAKLSFDSWSALPAAQIRNNAANVRRLIFNCGGKTFELQGSRRATDWQFVARFDEEEIGLRASLRPAKGYEIFPDEDGYFIWTSKNPESALTIEFPEEVYDITDIIW